MKTLLWNTQQVKKKSCEYADSPQSVDKNRRLLIVLYSGAFLPFLTVEVPDTRSRGKTWHLLAKLKTMYSATKKLTSDLILVVPITHHNVIKQHSATVVLGPSGV